MEENLVLFLSGAPPPTMKNSGMFFFFPGEHAVRRFFFFSFSCFGKKGEEITSSFSAKDSMFFHGHVGERRSDLLPSRSSDLRLTPFFFFAVIQTSHLQAQDMFPFFAFSFPPNASRPPRFLSLSHWLAVRVSATLSLWCAASRASFSFFGYFLSPVRARGTGFFFFFPQAR